MSRSTRRLGFAIIFTVIFVSIGTLGGFFNLNDLINRVQIQKDANEFGGETLTKVTFDDKSVSWTKGYDPKVVPTMEETKAYMYVESTNDSDTIVEYNVIYRIDSTLEDVVKFYEGAYTIVDMNESGDDIFIDATYDEFIISLMIEKDMDMIEVSIRASHEDVL